jgi:hypothetical protein
MPVRRPMLASASVITFFVLLSCSVEKPLFYNLRH